MSYNPEEFVAIKEQVEQFYNRDSRPSSARKVNYNGEMTTPHSPKFSTRKNPRNKTIHSEKNKYTTEEREFQELQNIKPFQALKLNKRVLYGEKIGLPKFYIRPNTQFAEFQLSSANKANKRAESEEAQMEEGNIIPPFKARSLNPKIFHPIVNLYIYIYIYM